MEPIWSSLFPEAGYRPQMGLRPGDGPQFFAPSSDHESIMRERLHWLDHDTGTYAAALDHAGPLIDDAERLVASWTNGPVGVGRESSDRGSDDVPDIGCPTRGVETRCRRLGIAWEPDWVVLSPDDDGTFRLAAGAVCFPSSWALREKLGARMSEIHAPVPGLNPALGRQIDTFLARIKPGHVWERENWGLSPNNELNHHPARHRPTLVASPRLDVTWLRVEHQLLARLTGTGGLFFAIRLCHHRVSDIVRRPTVAAALARTLESMPDEVARYKGLDQASPSLVRQLREAARKS